MSKMRAPGVCTPLLCVTRGDCPRKKARDFGADDKTSLRRQAPSPATQTVYPISPPEY